MPSSHFELLLHELFNLKSICRRGYLAFISTVLSRHITSLAYEDGSLYSYSADKWMDVKEMFMEYKDIVVEMGSKFRPVLSPSQLFWKAQKRYIAEAEGGGDPDVLWFAEMKRLEEIWPRYHQACSELQSMDMLDDSENTGSADDFQEVITSERSTMSNARVAVLQRVADKLNREDANQSRLEKLVDLHEQQLERLEEYFKKQSEVIASLPILVETCQMIGQFIQPILQDNR